MRDKTSISFSDSLSMPSATASAAVSVEFPRKPTKLVILDENKCHAYIALMHMLYFVAAKSANIINNCIIQMMTSRSVFSLSCVLVLLLLSSSSLYKCHLISTAK